MEFIKFIHRWAGLISGLVVFIVSITGACLVFEEEITLWGNPYAFVPEQEKDRLPPNVLLASGASAVPDTMSLASIWYGAADRSALLTYSDPQHSQTIEVYLNPYDASIVGLIQEDEEAHHAGFFHFMEEGHIHLWLPESIGNPIVAYSTAVFALILITGLIWWYPKKWTRGTAKKSFLIKWKARYKRLTIDLHNVPGFYSFLLALILAITGLYFSFAWVGKATYWVATGGEEPVTVQFPVSDTTNTDRSPELEILDRIWEDNGPDQHAHWGQLFIGVPAGSAATWIVARNRSEIASQHVDLRFYDQYSGNELFKRNQKTGEILKTDVAYRTMLYHYNIHLGRVGGRFTQWLAFLICIVCASLPLTGFLIWYNRKWGKKTK